MKPLELGDARPPYQQVADALRAEISSGRYRPGDRFPTHGEVATAYRVALGTVKRAYAELQDQGLIVTRQGQGSFVRATNAAEGAPASEITQLRERLDQLEARVHAIETGGAKSPKP
jgi:DNA-binding GntR family transcriptional regulator